MRWLHNAESRSCSRVRCCLLLPSGRNLVWIPAFAGMTVLGLVPGHAAPLQLTVGLSGIQAVIDDPAQIAQQLAETPGAATFLDSGQWQGQQAGTIKDITDYVPGVYAQNRDGAESARLVVRGSGLANTFQGRGVLILQDGVPINMTDGEFEFPVIDPWLIRYAEFLPGANALQDGASTLGGAIDFITPNGVTGEGYDVRAAGGSFDTLHGLVSAGQSWNGYDAFAAASGYHQDGFRNHNEQDTGRLNANLGWQPNDDFVNRIYISQTDSRPQVPGAITRAALEDDPTESNPNNARGNYERDLNITRLSDRSTWSDGPDRLETTLYYTYRDLDNPVTTYIIEHNNDAGSRLKFTHDFGLNKWIVGLNFGYGTQDETRYANDGGAPGRHILDRNLYAVTSETYTQYEQHLVEKLYGIVSLQGAYDTRNISQSTPVTGKQADAFAGYNPRAGLRYDLDRDTQLYGNISRSFEPPTFSELSGGNAPGFNQLDAQDATTEEIGARGLYKTLHWSASAYHSRLHDEFIDYQFANGDTSTINADKTVHDGLELGLNGDTAQDLFLNHDALVLRAAYTLSRFRLQDDPLFGDKNLPGVPAYYTRAELLYRHPSGFSFGPNVEWASRTEVDLANTLSAQAYAIYGARLLWDSADNRIDAYLEARNLADTHYAATTNVLPDANGLDSRAFYPGEGRAFYAGVGIKF